MWTIHNIENSSESLLDEYSIYFATNSAKTRNEKTLIVASVLKDQDMLDNKDARLLEEPLFESIYIQSDENLQEAINDLFPGLQEGLVSRVHAACLIGMREKIEPYASYISKTMDQDVIKEICSYPISRYTQPQYSQLANLIIKYQLATHIKDANILKEIQSQWNLIKNKNSIFTLSNLTLRDQLVSLAEFYMRLNEVHPFSVQLLGFDLTEMEINRSGPHFEKVLHYLSRNNTEQVKDRIYNKLIALVKKLDENSLVLGNLSLNSLNVDQFENIWVIDVSNSRILKGESFIRNYNTNNGKELWNEELKREGLKQFSVSKTKLSESESEDENTFDF